MLTKGIVCCAAVHLASVPVSICQLTHLNASPTSSRLFKLMEETREPAPLSSRKREMLQATLRIIQRGGFEALSLRRVAEQVGVKLSSVQYHFGNKEGLIAALINWALDWYSQELMELIIEHEDDPARCFEAIIDYLVDDLARRTGTEPHLWAYAMHSSEAANHRERYLLVYRTFLYELLTRLGTIESKKTRWMRAASISALIEGSYQLVGTGLPGDLRGYTRELKTTIFDLVGLETTRQTTAGV